MNAHYQNFKSGGGDCHFIILTKGKKQFVIMVDCGEFNEAIKKYINNTCKKYINLLIVTHIDRDHIGGVTEMLKKYKEDKNFIVERIWFNSYQATINSQSSALPSEDWEVINRLKPELTNLSKIFKGVVSSDQSMVLSDVLLTEKYEKEWKERSITSNNPNIDLGEWGRIKIISPSLERLNDLDIEYAKWFYEKLFHKLDKKEKYKGGETVFEVLIQYSEHIKKHASISQAISHYDFNWETIEKESRSNYTSDKSNTNGASIAFAWEYENNRILMLGDAWAEEVERGLINSYPTGPYPLIFDMIKVSHHGSPSNTSESLLNLIDSKEWYITGYTNRSNDKYATISRIICAPYRSSSVQERHFHFNCDTEEAIKKVIESDETLKTKYKFTADNNTHYEIR